MTNADVYGDKTVLCNIFYLSEKINLFFKKKKHKLVLELLLSIL